MRLGRRKDAAEVPAPRFPGVPTAVDGSTAVVEVETAASEGAGAYPITPSTQMGEGWAAAVAAGKTNAAGRRLIFFEPEGEHAAAAVTAGMSMVGLRATNFSSGQGIAYMHESLYAAAGKRLTYVLNVAARAMTKHALNVHAGHDDYHAVDDTGFFQVFAKDVQEVADLTLIAHRLAELSLTPGLCAQDGFLTSHVIESVRLPERALVREYLGDPADLIESPTPAQRLVFGERRRRIPETFNLDYPMMMGVVQNQDSYQQGVAAQRPFYFDHVAELADRAFDEYAALTGRRYARAGGYRVDDAEYVIVGQGSVVANAEAVCDYLRATRRLRVGVINVTMFRPFPADRLIALLRGRRGVVVLERVDQPLAVDAPLLREIRAAMSKALENGRAGRGPAPFPGLGACAPAEVPDLYSGCFGLGSRDVQPGDLVAAVDNMLDGGGRRRQFYLGIEFVRPGTRLPKLQLWQERLLDAYPDLAGLALLPVPDVDLTPEGSLALRIHSVGGWGAITMGKNLALTAAEVLGLHVKANPKYGSEKKGQPTTFYAALAREPIRLNCELRRVDVVLCPDPNAVRHSDPLAGLVDGGTLVIQSEHTGAALWERLPVSVRRKIATRRLRVFALDGFRIAGEEASGAELRYRMQAAAFMGAFFRVAPIVASAGLEETVVFAGIHAQLAKKFGRLGESVVEENLRAIRRGYHEVSELDVAALEAGGAGAGEVPQRPAALESAGAQPGAAHPGRFWEQVGFLYRTGQDGIADPFAALGTLPAATSSIRDMTDVRLEVPEFVASKCTGCSQCWTQCPDSAIPGVVNGVEDVLGAALRAVTNGRSLDRLRAVLKPIAAESRRLMTGTPFTTFGDVAASAYAAVADKLGYDAERRVALDAEWAPVHAALAEFPLARTAPFFDLPESRAKGTGGLLSITVNPETCKGCNVCVEVCPDGALLTIRQTDEVVKRLRRNWALWRELPDTDDRYVDIASLEQGIGVLPSLLLKKENYLSMLGGDGACMGCGEKTALHLVLAALTALLRPRVSAHVARLDDLIVRLDARARAILASDADLGQVGGAEPVALALEPAKARHVERLAGLLRDLRDLRWRYTEGPSGRGRALCGIANATGCSSVWASTYPFNPYPFPWVNHLFQDAPSIAIGIFEGHMRKMADGFAAIRRAELELADAYDPATHEAELSALDWRGFTDEELALCPPILAVGGDGAMLDIGFQNLSRLLASGKPIRVVMLDTQSYSNTGGQACTSGFFGQVSDMAEYGAAQHGKEETRKELALLAMAHRNVFLLQSSQAAPGHLLGGVLRALQSRSPAVMSLHCPCPPEHGVADDLSARAAKLALESRAFPLILYDPATGPRLADRLSLDGNPAEDEVWPAYELRYVDENGKDVSRELPVTVADWAATETRFRKHFTPIAPGAADETLTPFHEYLDLSPEERAERAPFIYTLGSDRRLGRMAVAPEIVRLADDRREVWALLRDMAGVEQPETMALKAEFERETAALRAEYEARLADLRARYPRVIARRLAETILRHGNGTAGVGELLERMGAPAGGPRAAAVAAPPAAATAAMAGAAASARVASAMAVAPAPAEGEALVIEPYIDAALCTACNECTSLNRRMFAYNDKKQAYIKDARAGSFKQLVQAAEKCPVRIIHPGTPLDPKEKDLKKWVERARPFA